MAVLFQSAEGWFVDHKRYIDDIYKCCGDFTWSPETSQSSSELEESKSSLSGEGENPYCRCIFREAFFDIHDQFHMDSWFQRHSQKMCQAHEKVEEETFIKPKRKKRKRGPVVMNEGLQAAQNYHLQIRDIIIQATKEIRSNAKKSGHFKSENYKVSTNNKEARELAKTLEGNGPPLAEWCYMAKDLTAAEGHILDMDLTGEADRQLPSLINVLIKYKGSTPTLRRLMGEKYLLPPQVAFLMSDISNMAPLVAEGQRYDLIVMDPPWNNKSVKRKRSYRELRDEDLLQLPLLAAPGALLVVWTTNRTAHHTFITESLFPHWGASRVATWYWVKVTQTGEFVTDIDDPHGKRPYETLILGRVGGPSPDVDVTSQPLEIPDQKVIVSVPCSVHSSKPPLQDLLTPYLPEGCRRLELFARNLQPGWTSWGNEVLKLQHVHCYQKVGVT